MSNARPLTATCAALAIAAALTGCGTTKTAATPTPERPTREMVVWNGDQTSDLYANGQINDTKGNRWDVAILPGFYPTMKIAGDSYDRSWGYIKNTGVRAGSRRSTAGPCPASYGTMARIRISSWTRSRKAPAVTISCFFPVPRTRSATLSLSASRCPTTAMYGTFCISPSRIR